MPKTQIDYGDQKIEVAEKIPVLPLRDLVIFPHMVMPFVVGRPATLAAIEEAFRSDRLMMLLVQKDSATEEPKPSDLYRVGVIGRMAQMMKLPNGLAKVLVEGLTRARVTRYASDKPFLQAQVHVTTDDPTTDSSVEAARRHAAGLFKEFVSLNRNIPDEISMAVDQIQPPRRLADFIIIHLNRDIKQKQRYLETDSIYDLMVRLSSELKREIEILTLEQNIEGKVKEKITRSQRNYFLQEQIRTIKKELGEDGEEDLSDVIDYRRKIKKAKMPKDVNKKAEEELKRLENNPMMSPEATVIRTYLDWLIDVPWFKTTEDNRDIAAAERILNEDHFGLEKPKERILEQLSVLSRAGKIKGPILCLVGPPGVGKTSLGKSVARALGRQFVRVSLGGVRDEAEIRGHRRTYIGSLPGRIIQSMKKAGTVNPVFLLDEVDKMSMDFRGDPSAALLEVLDPEQNHAFSDHYLEVDYNLSQILFITTANTRDGIPWPLQDRMEIIELPGYLHQEKYEIARRFLIPKQLAECGCRPEEIRFAKPALDLIIEQYTREAGVRELERCIAKIVRKSTRLLAADASASDPVKIGPREAGRMLGVPRYEATVIDRENRVGAAVGLAWTPTGGDVMIIEAELMRGKGTLVLTGKLGEVMQESARAALTAVRRRADHIGFDPDDYLKRELHIHFPEGAVPKDGPSAGITIAVAMASVFSGRKIRCDTAMTGEITLRGEVLPIGGLREKLMAALRAGTKRVIIPARNRKELAEVPKAVLNPLTIITVKTVDEVFDLMLEPKRDKSSRRRQTYPQTRPMLQ